MRDGRYWLQTLGCPKNQVDSDKLAGVLAAEGYAPAPGPAEADLVVVNTCAFIEAARQESIDAVLEMADARAPGARLVVTGCMAERYGDELADALPEVDLVAGFGRSLTAAPPPPARVPGTPIALRPRRAASPAHLTGVSATGVASFDLLSLPRPRSRVPWAYVKVAEGCDRHCGFCAIPSFRGAQRSRLPADVLAEVASLSGSASHPPHALGGAHGAHGAPRPTLAQGERMEEMAVKEIVLVAQDLASYGRDRTVEGGQGPRAQSSGQPSPLVSLLTAVAEMAPRTRLLYLYPSGLKPELIEAVLSTGVPYFDLSLQHVSRPHLKRMRRPGEGERFLSRIEHIRRLAPEATFRSSFIVGYPGETEEDHDALLEFLAAAELDWAGFFSYSREAGTFADTLPDQVPDALVLERLRECTERQDEITARRRDLLVGEVKEVLVDSPGIGRTVHEAPEIDGVVHVPGTLRVGELVRLRITEALGTDLVAAPLAARATSRPFGAAPADAPHGAAGLHASPPAASNLAGSR